MSKLLNLVQNEFQKMFARKKIWVFFGLLLIITLIAGGALGHLKNNPDFEEASIQQLTGQTFPLAMFEGLDDLLAIFVILLIADLITEEYVNGTLKVSLLRPVSRTQLLIAKVVVLAIVMAMLLIFTMIVSYIAGIIFLGWGDQMILEDQTLTTTQGVLTVVKGYLSMILPVTALGLVTMLISLHLNSVGSTIGIGLAIYFISEIAGQLSQTLRPFLLTTYFRYYLIVINGNWKQILNGLAAFLIYGGGCYLLSLITFKRKDLLH